MYIVRRNDSVPIRIERIYKKFENEIILENFSLDLPDSGIVCFYGMSGIGKTTLLNIISGTLSKDSGEILGLENKKISMTFQDKRLLFWDTVFNNVYLVSNGDKEKAVYFINAVGLNGLYDKKVSNLSGGQQSKLSIARALAAEFDVLIMDEPFSGIDKSSTNDLINLIKKNSKDKLVLFVTHSTQQAIKLSNEILIFKGRPLHIHNKINMNLLEEKSNYNSFFNYENMILDE